MNSSMPQWRQCLLLSQCSGSTSCYFGVLHLALYWCLLSQGVFIYCRVDAFFVNYHFLDTMMIFLLYGWSVVPLMYLGSLLFSSSPIAYIKLTLFNYFSTVFSVVFHIMVQHTGKDFTQFSPSPKTTLNKWKWKNLRMKIFIAKL